MSFDHRNGTLYFDNKPFATIGGAPWVGLELDALAALEEWQDPADMILEADHLDELEKAEKASYDAGHTDGEAAGRLAQESEFRDEWEADAFAKGRDSALVDAAKAEQVHRVDALVKAVAQSHDILQKMLNKRYPAAKVGECKDAMRQACSALRLAHIAYKHDDLDQTTA